LELAVGDDEIRVLLNPHDLEHLQPGLKTIVHEFGRMGRVEMVGDERIAAGGCRLETRHGAIDQQLATQLKRIEEELT
jgi:flagellar biosynthesis/type III secretory pathway protein FliH